jgi:hypothetical protein
VGAPQMDDIIKASVGGAVQKIEAVSSSATCAHVDTDKGIGH